MQIEIKEEQKQMAGIYKIINKINGNFYIGSAAVFWKRFKTHQSTLKNNKHHNDHLQKAYNKYGPSNFVFLIVEIVKDKKVLLEKENIHLKQNYGSINCYNMTADTLPESNLRKINEARLIEFELLGPDDKLHKFKGYTNAALLLQIKNVSISTVAVMLSKIVNDTGKSKSFKGWRLPSNKNFNYVNFIAEANKKRGKVKKKYLVKLLGPDKKVYGPIDNLPQFCKDHNVSDSIIANIIAKRTRYSNGWSLFEGSYELPITKNAKVFNIPVVSPEGIIYQKIENIANFCRTHNLNPSRFANLLKGKIKKGVYKGWRLSKKS